MTAGGGHFKCPFHALLSTDIGKIKLKSTLPLIKLLAGIRHGGLYRRVTIEECYDLGDVFHTIHVDIVHHGRFPYVLLRHYKPFETVGSGLYGYWQRSAHRLQASVQPQLTYHHIITEPTGVYLPVGRQYAYRQRQVVAASLLADIGRRHVHGYIGHRKLISVVLKSRHNAVVTLPDSDIRKPREVIHHPS